MFIHVYPIYFFNTHMNGIEWVTGVGGGGFSLNQGVVCLVLECHATINQSILGSSSMLEMTMNPHRHC